MLRLFRLLLGSFRRLFFISSEFVVGEPGPAFAITMSTEPIWDCTRTLRSHGQRQNLLDTPRSYHSPDSAVCTIVTTWPHSIGPFSLRMLRVSERLVRKLFPGRSVLLA
jgi:hypothetical protein